MIEKIGKDKRKSNRLFWAVLVVGLVLPPVILISGHVGAPIILIGIAVFIAVRFVASQYKD